MSVYFQYTDMIQLIISLCCFPGGGTGYVCEALQGGGVPDGAEAL